MKTRHNSLCPDGIKGKFSEDTFLGRDGAEERHISLVYSSSVEVEIDFKKVQDTCLLNFYPPDTDNEVIENWCEGESNRFFYQEVNL